MQAILERTETTLWGAGKVIDAATQAYRVLDAVERMPRPTRMKAAWPDTAIEWADVNGQGGAYKIKPPRIAPSAFEISCMVSVLVETRRADASTLFGGWFEGPIRGYPGLREYFMCATLYRARKVSDREMCRRKGWNLSTYQRGRDKGAAIVAEYLNRVAVMLGLDEIATAY